MWVVAGAGALLGALAAALGSWFEARQPQASGQSLAAPTTVPGPGLASSGLAQPAPQGPSATEIAEAVSKKLQGSARFNGPFPPFSLGGSLEKGGMFDIILRDHMNRTWRPVKDAVDVEIDWNDYDSVDLFVDATVRGAVFRYALLDVANGVPVVTSDYVPKIDTDPTWDELPEKGLSPSEELRHVIVRIPKAVGKKKYRLAVQPSTSENHPDDFWIAGQIIFKSSSLGGSLREWITFGSATQLSKRVLNDREAIVDWSEVVPPVTGVIAEVTIKAMNSVFQTNGQVRAVVRDLTDGTELPTEWTDVSWRGGMGMSNRPNLQVTSRQLIQLPHTAGIHKYVLTIEVSQSALAAAARGTLYFRN